MGRGFLKKKRKEKKHPLPLVLKFPFSKYLQQTYCAFLIMQSKEQALYLWISEKKAYTSSNVHSFTLFTDRHWNQEAEGCPNVPVHRSSQTHSNDALSKRGTPSIQSGFVRHGHIYIHLYSDIEDQGYNFSQELKAVLWLFNCTFYKWGTFEFPHRN